jgi:hypothetical protein
MEETISTQSSGLSPEQMESFTTQLEQDTADNTTTTTEPGGPEQSLIEPTGPNDEVELVVTANSESLEQGLTMEEFDMIQKTVMIAKAMNQKVVVRYRLTETESEIVSKYGNGDKQLAMRVIAAKFQRIMPGSLIGGIFGQKYTPEEPAGPSDPAELAEPADIVEPTTQESTELAEPESEEPAELAELAEPESSADIAELAEPESEQPVEP